MNKSCLLCGKKYFKKESEWGKAWEKRKYCSLACKYMDKKPNILFTCEECSQEKYRRRKEKNKRFCSSKCMYVWRSRETIVINRHKFGMKNENPNWKGGVNPINESLRKTKEYKLWRKAVFERDNWTCQICRKKGGEINADHIKEFALYPELRTEITNGRTLCVECHRKTFKFYSNQYV